MSWPSPNSLVPRAGSGVSRAHETLSPPAVHPAPTLRHQRVRSQHPSWQAFECRATRADADNWCTTPVALRGKPGSRAPSSSLGEEAAQQRDGAAGTPLPDPYRAQAYSPADDCPQTEPIGADATRRHCQSQPGAYWAGSACRRENGGLNCRQDGGGRASGDHVLISR